MKPIRFTKESPRGHRRAVLLDRLRALDGYVTDNAEEARAIAAAKRRHREALGMKEDAA